MSQGLVSPRALEPSPQLPWDKRGIAPHESRNWRGGGGGGVRVAAALDQAPINPIFRSKLGLAVGTCKLYNRCLLFLAK